MKAITLRNIPPDLAHALERRSRQNHKSLNRTVLEILESSLFRRSDTREHQLNHDLDWMAGTWTPEQADAFDEALAELRSH